jgi:hypothetical protein
MHGHHFHLSLNLIKPRDQRILPLDAARKRFR